MFFSRIAHIIKTNVQTNQIIILISVLLVGIIYFGINFSLEKLILVFGTTALVEVIFSRIKYGTWAFPYSGIPAGFGIAFFLRTDILSIYVLAGFLAIASKYIFRIGDRHFFNPSNFGVFVILVLFPYITWTNPLQWSFVRGGMDISILYIALIALGIIVMWRVYITKKINLLYIVLPFMLTHLFILLIFSSENILSYHLIYSPAFFIFTFFMITDPQTVLLNIYSRIVFGSLVALLFYILQYYINENYALLGSLFILTMSIPLIRYLDTSKYHQSITYGNILISFIFFICISVLIYMIYAIGEPDLVFDNRCRALFCN